MVRGYSHSGCFELLSEKASLSTEAWQSDPSLRGCGHSPNLINFELIRRQDDPTNFLPGTMA